MSEHPDPLQVLFLWGLLARGGEAWKAEVRPDLKGRYAPLKRAGLLDEERRPHPETGRARTWVRLSEGGWAWAQAHLDSRVSARSTAAGPTLQALLARLGGYLAASGTPLVEVIRPEATPPAAGVPAAEGLSTRIRSAYLAASGGQWNVRVRLHELRRLLPDVPRQALDGALLDLARQERLALYPLDDPLEIRESDREAAIERLGERLHLVYMRP
jgi:hypothetical protein